ncbi:MAG TPA: AMP-binding protein, partial [Candidatus Limnocylindria bacterium]|nr:AMP-binding protein [Candidatus Limnocylindria bacterium]
MTTTAPEETAEAVQPRLMQTEIEPLDIPAELRADSLVALVHNSVLRNPEKEALRWKLPKTKRQTGGPPEEEAVEWTSTSYRQTWDWITQVAMGLKHLGIRDGDRVCIMSRTRPAWLAADLGSLSLGAVTCPIYPSVEPNQAAFVINNVEARLIFVENLQQAAKIDQVRAECPSLEHVVVIDDRGKLPAGAISFDDIFDLATADPGEIREWTESWQRFGRDKVATIVHTSGTTANPKGVVLTHGNILHNFEGGVQAVDFNEDDLFLS